MISTTPAESVEAIRRDLYRETYCTRAEEGTTVSTDLHTTTVHPVGLMPGDRLLRDPDAPDREIDWRIGHVDHGRPGPDGIRVVVAEYKTADGTEGTHGFEDQYAELTVAVRKVAPEATLEDASEDAA